MTRQGLEVSRRRKSIHRVHEKIAKASGKQSKQRARRIARCFSANQVHPAVHYLFLAPPILPLFSPLVGVYCSSANNNNPQIFYFLQSRTLVARGGVEITACGWRTGRCGRIRVNQPAFWFTSILTAGDFCSLGATPRIRLRRRGGASIPFSMLLDTTTT